MDKRSKIFHTRAIRTQQTSYTNGNLSIPEFLQSRSFEISSFEQSQLRTKAASSTRVFQALPRSLRRRTASHNVKRIPKRLRNRAIKEMSDTNVTKSKKLSGRERYKLKMKKKLLKLSSRIRLYKEIPITEDNLKLKISLLNQQLKGSRPGKKINNILGSIDLCATNTYAPKPFGKRYNNRQLHHVWTPTHIWHAKRFHMIKRYGYQYPLKPTMKCFKLMNREMKHGTVAVETSYYDCLLFTFNEDVIKKIMKVDRQVLSGGKSGYGMIYHDVNDPSTIIGEALIYVGEKVLIRVHPLIYQPLFDYLKTMVDVEDCRYALGSLELLGPTSLFNLNKIFHTDADFKHMVFNDSLKNGTTFALSIKDPRLFKPKTPKSNIDYNDFIMSLKVDKHAVNKLFSSAERTKSYQDQLSIKQLNHPPSTTSEIPIMLTKYQERWVLICPWYWVSPIHYSLTKAKIKFGGEFQINQFCFERSLLKYPQDFPFLPTSWQDSQLEIRLGLEKYSKLPKSKQHQFDHEHGLIPFGPDWEFLYLLKKFETENPGVVLEDKRVMGEFNGIDRKVKTIPELIEFINESRTMTLCISNTTNDNKLFIKPIKFEVNGSCKPGDRIYCQQVNIFKLVGFVTTGGNNLLHGKGTGIAYIIDCDTNDLIIRSIGSSKSTPIHVQQ